MAELKIKPEDDEEQYLPNTESSLQSKIGALFSQARSEKNLSIQAVASVLRIRQLYLESIEEGRFDLLPGTVYAIGFIKTYARFLDLDGDEIIRQLELLSDADGLNSVNSVVVFPQNQGKPTRLLLILSAFLAFSFCIGLYFWNHQSQNIQQEVISSTPEKEPAVSVGGDVSSPHQEIVQAVTVDVPSPDESTEKLPESPSLSTQTDPISAVESTPIKLQAEADAWVEVRDQTGKVIFMKILPAGEIFSVPDQPGFILNTGNAGGLSIVVGDKKTQLLGKKGQVLRGISLDLENLKKFM